MRNSSLLLVVLGMVLLLAGCVKTGVDKEAEKQKLMELSQQWAKVAQTGTIDSTLTYWADNAVMMPPGKPPLKGKQEIRKYLESTSNIPGFEISWEPVSAHISDDGSMAYMIERNKVAFTDSLGNRVVQHNKVTTVWRKNEEGNWENVVDMWNKAPAEWSLKK